MKPVISFDANTNVSHTGCDLMASQFACGRRCTRPDIDLQQPKTSLDSDCVAALVALTTKSPDLPTLGRDGLSNANAGGDAVRSRVRIAGHDEMSTRYDPNKRLKRLDAGLYLLSTYGVGSPTYLATLAVRGGGPTFELIRNRAMYMIRDLDAWALQRSSSDKGGAK